MTTARLPIPSTFHGGGEKAITLALSLAQAERAIHECTAGQVDAIIDPDGRAYLLRPAQEHLRQDETRLRAILDSVGDGITVVNRGGLIVSQNRAATRMLGYRPNELIGRNFFEFVDSAELNQFHSSFFNVIEEFRADAFVEFHLQTRDGSFRRVEATVSKLREFTEPCVVLICRDMTQRQSSPEPKTREIALTASLLDKDRFLSMLSHELRTPLTPVLLGIRELQESEPSPESQATLKMIWRNLDLQSHLLDELIDFTTLGQHKVRLRPEVIDAHEAIGFVLEICRGEIAAAQIEVSLDLRAATRLVIADALRFQQVMWNLIKNAVKFSPAGSAISIATSNDTDGRLTIDFADHGIGIEADLLPRVFDCFQQGKHSGRQRNDGLGLGLYIAKGLAEAQGGTLTVQSAGRGQGATFRLSLATTSPPFLPPPSL